MSYTHYRLINRDDHTGVIRRVGEKHRLGKSGINGVPGATCEDVVVSVEPGAVMGWDDATAIGRVQRLINGDDEGRMPALALLS